MEYPKKKNAAQEREQLIAMRKKAAEAYFTSSGIDEFKVKAAAEGIDLGIVKQYTLFYKLNNFDDNIVSDKTTMMKLSSFLYGICSGIAVLAVIIVSAYMYDIPGFIFSFLAFSLPMAVGALVFNYRAIYCNKLCVEIEDEISNAKRKLRLDSRWERY